MGCSFILFGCLLNQNNGLINNMLRNSGQQPIQWYMTAGAWPAILTFMYLWKSTGYNMVIYLSSISGIDTTLYEAAVMDGANKRQQVFHITLPCLKNVIIMMFILNVGKIFYSDFGLFYQLSQEQVVRSLRQQQPSTHIYTMHCALPQ